MGAVAGAGERGHGLVESLGRAEQPDTAALPAALDHARGGGTLTMRYFHRTSASPEQVLDVAKTFFGGRLAPAEESPRRRAYQGTLGRITIRSEERRVGKGCGSGGAGRL